MPALRCYCVAAGLVCSAVLSACQRDAVEPLEVTAVISTLKQAGWDYERTERVRLDKSEHRFRLSAVPLSTHVDLYVLTAKPPMNRYVERVSFNVWSDPETIRPDVLKAINTATDRLSKVIPDVGELIAAAKENQRKEMHPGIARPIRLVGRARNEAGWKVELIAYKNHPMVRQEFVQHWAVVLKFEI